VLLLRALLKGSCFSPKNTNDQFEGADNKNQRGIGLLGKMLRKKVNVFSKGFLSMVDNLHKLGFSVFLKLEIQKENIFITVGQTRLSMRRINSCQW
jgi:hypothetical protein